jgi:site-specific recombinase XerD
MTGRATVRNFIAVWLDEQKHSVSAKTYTADADRIRSLIDQRGDREITRVLIILTKSGLAESSVRHFRDSLSSFFAWAVRERMIAPAMAIRRPAWSRPTSRPVRRAACHSLPTQRRPVGRMQVHQRVDQVGLRQLR